MKRILSVITVIALLCCLSFNTFAIEKTLNSTSQNEVEFLSDGSYIVSSISLETSGVSTMATNTKTGTKSIKYYNSNDEIEWTATLKGTFTYTGSSSTCTYSSISYTIVDNSWKITSATASRSGNKATGNVTAKHYLLGIPVKTVEKTITLSCSASGVLS